MDATPAPLPVPTDPTPVRPRVLVLFGGRSGEHTISCATAGGVLRAIDRDRYDVLAVGITRDGHWVLADDDPDRWAISDGRLPEVEDTRTHVLLPQGVRDREVQALEAGQVPRALGEVDVVFPLLHGPFGEDGTVQGLFELADVRYVGSGVLASAVGMDKHMMKVVLAGHGLPVGEFEVVLPSQWRTDRQAVLDRLARLGLPVFVKPARAGSSLGISRADSLDELLDALATAQAVDPKVIVEAAVVGREVECGVLGGRGGGPARASLPGEIVVTDHRHRFYDYEAKYFDSEGVRLACPADLPDDVVARVQEIAVAAFDAIGCEGIARVDVFVTPDGAVQINEINTMPGFTPYSMYPMMWQASGLSYPELVDELLALALARPTGLR